MEKIRGFEKVTYEQFAKDIKEEFYLEGDVVKDIYDIITIPKRSTARSAGYDIVSPIDFELEPMQDIKLPTGLKVYMLEDEDIKIYPRSSLGFKYYLRFANTTPIGDSDFFDNKKNEGHYWIKVRNEGTEKMKIRAGEKICQVIFEKYLLADGDDFSGKTREGGLGSTGKVAQK